jgi:hypothetical protein
MCTFFLSFPSAEIGIPRCSRCLSPSAPQIDTAEERALPAPEGPIIETTSPFDTVRDTLFTATRFPKRFSMP